MSENTILILIRGLPGSGKSTLAKKLAEKLNCSHYEADMYFMSNGEYKFDISKLSSAHNWCFNSTESDIKSGEPVIVSNTFTTIKEIDDYINLGLEYGGVTIINCSKEYGSIHNVPELAMDRMKRRYVTTEALRNHYGVLNINFAEAL